MNKELMELKLRIDCFRCELEKELDCFSEFFTIVEFFLAKDIEDRVVLLWLEDYKDDVDIIKGHLDSLEKKRAITLGDSLQSKDEN